MLAKTAFMIKNTVIIFCFNIFKNVIYMWCQSSVNLTSLDIIIVFHNINYNNQVAKLKFQQPLLQSKNSSAA